MSTWKDKVEVKTGRIALVYPKAIGDLVFLIPALHSLRKGLPEAHLTLVVKDKQEPLAKGFKGRICDEVLSIGAGTGIAEVRRRLVEDGTDLFLDLAGNDKSGMILAFQKGGSRLRPDKTDCRGMSALYSAFADSLQPSARHLHRVDQLMGWVQEISQCEPVYSFQMYLDSEAVEHAERIIARHSLREGKVVVLNVGASRNTKRWPASHFQTLAAELRKEGCRVVFTGANEFSSDGHYDRQISDELRGKRVFDGEACIDLITDEDITPGIQLQRDAHFLRYSGVPAVVVGCDTGPMQIAGSVGSDAHQTTISLFGPTSWRRYAPYDPSRVYPGRTRGAYNWVLTAGDVVCRPAGIEESCGKYRAGCKSSECMAKIMPETVLKATLDTVFKCGTISGEVMNDGKRAS
ncbi:MAG: glycosyltransferase family 9 protein [bacterium]